MQVSEHHRVDCRTIDEIIPSHRRGQCLLAHTARAHCKSSRRTMETVTAAWLRQQRAPWYGGLRKGHRGIPMRQSGLSKARESSIQVGGKEEHFQNYFRIASCCTPWRLTRCSAHGRTAPMTVGNVQWNSALWRVPKNPPFLSPRARAVQTETKRRPG
jgi:hypothetical protein